MTNNNNKKIGIFGLGISGISSFNFLEKQENTIICWDDSETNRNKFKQKYLFPLSDPVWQNLDKIIISPGIPNSHAIFLLALKYNILISSDIEVFLETNYDSEIIIITGTNGKSTVTSLIGHILTENKLDYHIGGNIGLPVLSLPQHAKGYILELSSFQLDLLHSINPTIAVLLNLTPDHLDRHKTYSAYCKAKEKALLGDGLKIIGTNSKDSKNLYDKMFKSSEKNLIPINLPSGICCNSTKLTDNFFDLQSYNLPELKNLVGQHNYENIASAFGVCRALGISGEDIIKHLSGFKGLPHRMQFIGKHKHISFYNDSKATNVSSAIASLSVLDNIFWLAGGVFKEKNLLAIEKFLKNIKKVYLFGKSRVLFKEYLEGKIDYIIFETMEEAFNAAVNDAILEKKPANILLAPACASFDQFNNFEDRGNKFINFYNAKF
tara:strand:+ start:2612 stop:3922 length:1311 start_codon:yes stop_codon:yes gene_type:complete